MVCRSALSAERILAIANRIQVNRDEGFCVLTSRHGWTNIQIDRLGRRSGHDDFHALRLKQLLNLEADGESCLRLPQSGRSSCSDRRMAWIDRNRATHQRTCGIDFGWTTNAERERPWLP